MMRCSSWKKIESIFCTVYFVRRNFFFWHLCFISMYSGLNTLSNYTKQTFTYQKISFHTLFCLFSKSSKTFSISLTPCRKELYSPKLEKVSPLEAAKLENNFLDRKVVIIMVSLTIFTPMSRFYTSWKP